MFRQKLDQNSIWNVHQMKDNVDLRPPYQRGKVWTTRDEDLLIDSLFRNFSVGKIFWRKVERDNYSYEVIDGQQRLRTIWAFLDGRRPRTESGQEDVLFKLPPDAKPGLADKTYTGLDLEVKMQLGQYQLDIEVVEGASEEEVRDMFRRLQLGRVLRAGEKLKAMYGDMYDFVMGLLKHRIFRIEGSENRSDLLRFRNIRDVYVEVAAQVTRLSLNRGPCNIGYDDLEAMFDGHKTWPTRDAEGRSVRSDLDFLSKVLAANGFHPDKTLLVTLHLFVSGLRREFPVKPKQIMDFIKEFEQARFRQDLQDEDLLEYNKAVFGGSGRERSLRKRYRTLVARFLAANPSLRPRDEQEEFSEEQRWAIYWRDKGVCQVCGQGVSDRAFHADHKVRWTDSGPTTVENGQTLCMPCHREKTAAEARSRAVTN